MPRPVMITVCAWCQRLLGADPEDRLLMSHGICGGCQAAARACARRGPTLIVPLRHADLVPALHRLLHDTGIPVVLDRRIGQRRRTADGTPGEDRRRGPDRRESASPVIT